MRHIRSPSKQRMSRSWGAPGQCQLAKLTKGIDGGPIVHLVNDLVLHRRFDITDPCLEGMSLLSEVLHQLHPLEYTSRAYFDGGS